MLSRCFLDCSVGVGFFVTGLSQISFFLLYPTGFIYKILQTANTDLYVSENMSLLSDFQPF